MKVLLSNGRRRFANLFNDYNAVDGVVSKEFREAFIFSATFLPLIVAIENNDAKCFENAKKLLINDMEENFSHLFEEDLRADSNKISLSYIKEKLDNIRIEDLQIIDTEIDGPGFINEYDCTEFWTPIDNIVIFK